MRVFDVLNSLSIDIVYCSNMNKYAVKFNVFDIFYSKGMYGNKCELV